jgi:hypothetical protein
LHSPMIAAAAYAESYVNLPSDADRSMSPLAEPQSHCTCENNAMHFDLQAGSSNG